LRGVHSTQRFEIRRIVFAYAHGTDFNTECTENTEKTTDKSLRIGKHFLCGSL
jgi:hypothetical protein